MGRTFRSAGQLGVDRTRCIVSSNPVPRLDWWGEWSSIVDAPVSGGMTRDEFLAYYRLPK
jgi:hypothetical protein